MTDYPGLRKVLSSILNRGITHNATLIKVIKQEEVDTIVSEVESLSSENQELYCRVASGERLEDIAELLNLSLSTVKRRKSMIINRIGKALNG
jgi:DNA-binding NarL/FixJ family response regulator